jgi:hypothetical protein
MHRMSRETTPGLEMYDMHHYWVVQKVEIEEHRYYMGEKLTRETGEQRHIGDNEVMLDWISSGHAARFNKTYMAHLATIEEAAKEYDERIPSNLVHKILED